VGRDLGPVTALAGPFFHTDAVVASTVSCQTAPGSVRPGLFDLQPQPALIDILERRALESQRPAWEREEQLVTPTDNRASTWRLHLLDALSPRSP
jgi:hypothetical protein